MTKGACTAQAVRTDRHGAKVGRDCGCYQMTSPQAVRSGLVIVGSSIGDNCAGDLERSVVRAYDVRSGVLR